MTGLLDLPPELRNRIYFMIESLVPGIVHEASCTSSLCTQLHHDVVGTIDWVFKIGKMSIPSQPAITRVCRQLRHETIPIYYGSNRFRIVFRPHNVKPFPDPRVVESSTGRKLLKLQVQSKNAQYKVATAARVQKTLSRMQDDGFIQKLRELEFVTQEIDWNAKIRSKKREKEIIDHLDFARYGLRTVVIKDDGRLVICKPAVIA